MPGNKKKMFVYLTPKGRLLKAKLVPLAEEVNAIAARNVKAADIATTRQTLLAIIENLARDELEASADERRIPSTREWAERGAAVAKGKRARAKKRA